MAMLAWVMIGLAIWHFTIWLPDRHWGGIVGSLIGALIGSMLCGLLIHGFTIPARDHTHLVTALEGVPGTLVGIAVVYWLGARRERAAAAVQA